MNRALLLAAAVALCVAPLGVRSASNSSGTFACAPAHADEVDVTIFYDELAPYGTWCDHAVYGRVWAPSTVAVGWRPYTTGRWVWIDDCGWTWVADEPWGWAAFHYGRWYCDGVLGWIWVPGPVWAPAWVVWRTGPSYCGWAPLPPSVGWSASVEFSVSSTSIAASLAVPCWSFVAVTDFCAPHVHKVVVPAERNVVMIKSVDRIVAPKTDRAQLVNVGPEVADIERATGRRVERARLREVDRPDAIGKSRGGDGDVPVFRGKSKDPSAGSRGPADSRNPDTENKRRRDDANALKRRQDDEAERQRAAHEREIREARDDVARRALRERQEAERRALAERQARERRALEPKARPKPPPRVRPPATPPKSKPDRPKQRPPQGGKPN